MEEEASLFHISILGPRKALNEALHWLIDEKTATKLPAASKISKDWRRREHSAE